MNEQTIVALIKHAVICNGSYEVAVESLSEKYPEQAGEIAMLAAALEDGSYEADQKYFEEGEEMNLQDMNMEVERFEAEGAAMQAVQPKPLKTVKAAKPKVNKVNKVSKLDQAVDLYQASEDKSRKVMIDLFVEKLGMSKAGASTYYYNVKARVEGV